VTGVGYNDWISTNVIERAGLKDTTSDYTPTSNALFADGYTEKYSGMSRRRLWGTASANQLASATGFVSTAADLSLFYSSLQPDTAKSFLAPQSRRQLVKAHWREPDSNAESYYGLGSVIGRVRDWPWFGHGGGFPGFITQTTSLLGPNITISLLINSIDGPAQSWTNGIVAILDEFRKRAASEKPREEWCGRWHSILGTIDLVPIGERILINRPANSVPFEDASEIARESKNAGRVIKAPGFLHFGEPVVYHAPTGLAPERLTIGGHSFLREPDFFDQFR
jgi:D-alanyl-D-alanine carboxypeptidase